MIKIGKDGRGVKRTVLITGATGGIGRKIAIRFAEEGWNILCHYFSSDPKAAELKRAIGRRRVGCRMLKADFSSKYQLMEFIGLIRNLNIDSLVNNAATPVVNRHFSQLALDDITSAFMINTFAPMLLSADVFMRMKKRRFGRIVNISSVAAKYGGSDLSMHYGSSKRALEGVTKTLAREGARYNILVNTIRPGVIDTGFYKKFPKDMKRRIAMIPLRKMGAPEDIADMAYYLGSERNDFMTNEIVTMAGGE